MNSRKRTRTSLHNSQNEEDNSTPKNETKHNLLTSCRRVGLNRKKSKSLSSSQTSNDALVTSTFVEEDLKKISAVDISNTNSDIIEEKSLLISTKLDSDNNSLDNIKPNIKKPRVVSSRKRKLLKDLSKSKEVTSIDKPSITHDSLQSSSVVDSSSNAQNSNELPDSNENKSESPTQLTIPVSINLTRCDLNALKLKLLSPKKSKIDETTETSTENKENRPAAENTQISDSPDDNNSKVDNTKNIEENNDQQDKATPENSPRLVPNETVAIENNSLEENSDGSDFYPEVVRRKKKKVLTNKQRNISKPSPSDQKENITSTSKRTSANNTPCYSDSDDDFRATPVRRGRKSSQRSENSQNSEKDEKVKKKKLKMKKPTEDELVKTGHIRLSENKSYTIIQRDNYVSYVKSFDNDVNFKVTESDDNQQLPIRNSVNSPKKTMIVERKDYITKRRSSLSKNIELLMEMPSIFADINDVASTTEEFQKPNEENKEPKSSKTVDRISVVKTSKLQSIPKNLTNQTSELQKDMKNKQIITDQQKDPCTYENKQKISESENIKKPTTITTTSEQCIDKIISENSKISEDQENKSTSEISKSEKTNVSGPSGLKNDKLSEKSFNITVAKIVEEFNTESSENEESSDLPESEDDNTSTSSKSNETISKLLLQNEELQNMTVKQLTDELSLLENNVKKKEERLQSLKRISIYKETHNLEQLRQVTLQTKRGSQNALVDLVLSLKEQSSADFTMSTLLEFMKIPNELVGYNEQEDKFI